MAISCMTPLLLLGQPRISSFGPAEGAGGTLVNINGQNFHSNVSNNKVQFGQVQAQVVSASTNQLTVQAPLGASYQPLSVTQNGLTGYSNLPFILTHPSSGFEFLDNRFGLQVRMPGFKSRYPPRMHDMTGDGKPDLIFLDHFLGTLRIWENQTVGNNPAFQEIYQTPWSGEAEIFALEDLNGDGKPEMVVVNYITGQISVFRNNSSGTNISFSNPLVLSPTAKSLAITIADIDNDGRPDIISANAGNPTQKSITVFRNSGIGSELQFNNAGMFGNHENNFNICHADFDGDGRVDIAVAYAGGTNGAFLRNTSTANEISFQYISNVIPFSSPFMFTVVVGDFNDDGKPDVTFCGQGIARTLINNSTPGNFVFNQASMVLSTGGNTYFAGVADLNGDGKSDLVTFAEQNQFAQLSLFGASPGTQSGFLPRSNFRLDDHSAAFTLGDINLDGKTDIWVTNTSSGQFSFILNGVSTILLRSFSPTSGTKGDTIRIKGTGFSGGVSSVSFGGIPATSFAVQNDTSMFAIVGNGASGPISAVGGSGTSLLDGFVFRPPPVITSVSPLNAPPGEWVTIVGTDLTLLDSVIIGGRKAQSLEVISPSEIRVKVPPYFIGGRVEIFTQSGQSSFPGFYNGHTLQNIHPMKALPGQDITIEGSGFSNNPQENQVFFGTIAAKIKSSAPGQLIVEMPKGAIQAPISVTLNGLSRHYPIDFNPVFEGAEAATNAGTFAPRKDFQVGQKTKIVRAADMNGDGFSDAIFYFWVEKSLTVLLNKTKGDTLQFEPVLTPLLPEWVNDFVIGDLNNDGKPDIAVICSPWIVILKNTSTPQEVSFEKVFQVASYGDVLKISDMDQDGLQDIVLSSQSSNKTTIFRNAIKDDQWVFERNEYSNVGFLSGYWMEVADLDLDGLPDILISDNSGVKIWANQSSPGHIKFGETSQITAPNSTISTMLVRDFNRDGLPDILLSSDAWASDANLYHNESVPGSIAFADDFVVGPVFPAISTAIADFNGDGNGDVLGVWGEHPGSVGLIDYGEAGGAMDRYLNFQAATSFRPFSVAAADFNHDGKPDFVSAGISERINFFLNITKSMPGSDIHICPNGSVRLVASFEGQPVSWQMSLDSGNTFIPVPNDNKHEGQNQRTLKIENIPSVWYGRIYRPVSGGIAGKAFTLKFRNIWQADQNAFWSDPINWSCSLIPDENTDVVIQRGNVTIGFFPRAVCRTLTILEGSNINLLQWATIEVKK